MRAILLLLLCILPLTAAPKTPAWFDTLRGIQTPAYSAKVGAVVLLNERRVTVDGQGKTRYSVRYAVRIISNDGRRLATGRMIYRTDTGKAGAMSAWLVTPSGTIKEYGKKETLDIALAENDVFNESRARVIMASGEAIPGSVFAFEGEAEDKSVFTQSEWLFQDEEPVLTSRFALQLPAGWRAESKSYNRDEIKPEVSGSSYTWELRNLAPIEVEENSPGVYGMAPRLAVSYFPPGGATADAAVFATWKDVSGWLSALNDSQTGTDAALTAKVAELTSAATTERAKVAEIAQFVQRVKYVSIQIGTSRGGGYRPHSATQVFAKLYGDCKDKTNLMRTMLREAGIESFPVAIFSGDPTYVREDWPSPHQFNHAIIAVKVGEDFEAPAVREYPGIGRVLFFDPTDEYTPLGYLPDHEQGSFALVVHAEHGALVEVPRADPEANHLERTIRAELRDDGSLVATVAERCAGQSASYNRMLHQRSNESDYRKIIERWIAAGVPGSTVEKIGAADRVPDFELDVEISAPSYGQIMNGRLWMFRPALIERRGWYGLRQDKRTQPFLLSPDSYTEVVEVLLPKSFKVDEIPASVAMETEFGTFDASWEHADGLLIFKRSFRTEGGPIPSSSYVEMRKFLRSVAGAAQAAVVLEKQ